MEQKAVMEKSWKLKKINKVMETEKSWKKVMEKSFVRVATLDTYCDNSYSY